MFVTDEAQLLVPKIFGKAVATDTWVTTDFATRLRKRGQSLVVITRSPASIEDDIRKNARNVFVFRLQDPKDIRVIAGMMGSLHSSEVSYYASFLTTMPNRKAIVKTPIAENPFLARSLDLPLQPVARKMLEGLSPQVRQDRELSEDEGEVIRSLAEHPFLANTGRAHYLGWHRSRFAKARKSLLTNGLVEEMQFKVRASGAPSHFLKVKGKEDYGKGGFIHAYWVDRICSHLRRRGYDPRWELKIDGKMADIAYQSEGKLIIVEVEHRSDWKGNILRGMSLCDSLVSVFIRKGDYTKAKLFLRERDLEGVSIAHAYSFADVLS